MVYETDFYTVRRPRPTITSYSVTSPRLGVSSWNVKPSVRTSVLLGELDRIYHRPRPQLGHIHLEDYLNSRPLVDFDDETKQIRAETDRLRRRIHLSIPHPRHSAPVQPLPYYGSCYDRVPSPEKHYHNMVDDILCMSYYSEPTARTIGRGHLACVTFAGGRGYPRRRNHYSDESRDIGGEIKTRSYYHNNFNKNYVDAMSLPTGYASYLLRLKPPESNETLTNLDKMHIIALAEERKKNMKRNKTDGDLSDSEPKSKWLNGFSAPAEQNTSKVLKKQLSKSNDETISKKIEEPKQETPVEEINKSERKLSKQASITKPELDIDSPKEVILETESKVELPEVVKPEKKSKQKKSSLSRNSSVQENPKPVVEEEMPKAEEKKVELPKEEEKPESVYTKPIEEPLVIEESKHEPESQKTEAEAVDDIKQETTPEIPPPSTELPSNDLVENTLPTTELTTAEPSTQESAIESAEQREKSQPVESNTVSNEAAVEPVQVLSEPNEIPVSKTNETVIEGEQDIPSDQKETVEASTNEEIVALESQEAPIEVVNGEDVTTEVNSSPEMAVTESTDVVLTESVPETVSVESSHVETEVSEFQTKETTVITSTVVTTTTEINVSENIIEEVSHSSDDMAQKGNESEPLIEEPQSPCDNTNIIIDQNSSDICEVLSDVPEES